MLLQIIIPSQPTHIRYTDSRHVLYVDPHDA